LLLVSWKEVTLHGSSPFGWICPSHRERELPSDYTLKINVYSSLAPGCSTSKFVVSREGEG
jgi:hypothetical protein